MRDDSSVSTRSSLATVISRLVVVVVAFVDVVMLTVDGYVLAWVSFAMVNGWPYYWWLTVSITLASFLFVAAVAKVIVISISKDHEGGRSLRRTVFFVFAPAAVGLMLSFTDIVLIVLANHFFF